MAHSPDSGADPAGSSVTVRPLLETTKVDSVGAPHPDGEPVPAPAAEFSTATVAELRMGSEPPKKPFMNGVRNENGALRVTVSVFPAPPPPGDCEQAMLEPFGAAQAVARLAPVRMACSPPWPWTLRSRFARASMPAVSIGFVAP